MAIIYVNQNAAGSNNGSSWENAYTDLQSALLQATDLDEIWVAAGVYKPTVSQDRLVSFNLKSGVEIYGGFLGNEASREQRNWQVNKTFLSGDIGTVGVSADNSYHVVRSVSIPDASTRLDGFEISEGNASINQVSLENNGAGILNIDSNAIFANLVITNNTARESGGGVYNSTSADAEFINVTFTNNRARLGGGLFNGDFQAASTTLLSLSSVTFTDNIAVNGAGIYNDDTLTINGGNFSDNSASNDGGFLYNNGGFLSLFNAQINDNTATDGGAIYNFNGSSNLINIFFRNNSAISPNEEGGAFGGAITTTGVQANLEVSNGIFDSNSSDSFGGAISSFAGGFVDLVNVTLSRNNAVTGGGLYARDNADVVVGNSIFWDNRASSGAKEIFNEQALVNVTYSIVDSEPVYPGLNNLNANPLFVNGAVGDFNILENSPAVNAGNGAIFPVNVTTDISGNPRIFRGAIDIGAYEYFVLDPAQYGASYGDLIVGFGYNLPALKDHYFNAGRFEGRSFDSFDELRYTASYPDLITGFGLNPAAVTEHYIRHGFFEGRSLTAFDGARYLLSYPDLLAGYDTNIAGGTSHYITNGFAEGRNPNLFPSDRYIASYGDLILTYRYNLEAGSNHYLFNGRGEGRQIIFDPQAYLNRYPDLQAGYGNDLVGATRHFIEFGFDEGRAIA